MKLVDVALDAPENAVSVFANCGRAVAHVRGGYVCHERIMRAGATPSHFGAEGTTNSGMSLTSDLIEFEMKHCASALSMISRVRSSSASSFTVI